MAGDGRNYGTDPFDVAARREDADAPVPDTYELSADPPIASPRRWPCLLKRWAALGSAVIVATASAFVLGRSLAPGREEARAQELAGRSPQRNYVASVDLSPDWTHTRGIDERRSGRRAKAKARHRRGPRHATIRVGGGPSRTTTTLAASAPTGTSSPPRQKNPGNNPGGRKDNRNEAAAADPELSEPSIPLYHLYRTFKKKKPNHYFTGDEAVKDAKIEEGWQFLATEGFMFDRALEGTVGVPADNGIPGYIYEKREPGSLPLYMLRGYNGYGDIFTSDAAYREKMIEEGWNDFGIVGYIAQT